MSTLKDQVAIVTGGGTGIGEAVALALAGAGARVAVCGRREEPIRKTARAIEAAAGLGDAGLAIQADVSEEADVERLVKTVLDTFGGIDILVNNAGISGGDFIHHHAVDDWDRVMAVNLRGPFLLCRAVLPHLRTKGRGRIINISSESGLEHYPGDGAYGVSKHALNALGEYIQRENQEHGIQVNTICPGMVVTEMTVDSPGLDRSKALEPEDIARLVLYLLEQPENLKIGRPVLIQTMLNPWK